MSVIRTCFYNWYFSMGKDINGSQTMVLITDMFSGQPPTSLMLLPEWTALSVIH